MRSSAWYSKLAKAASHFCGRPPVFALALAVIAVGMIPMFLNKDVGQYTLAVSIIAAVYLQQLFEAHGLGGDRLALLYGGMDTDERERVKAEFQHDPTLRPVRILLATDAASEGIDLQRRSRDAQLAIGRGNEGDFDPTSRAGRAQADRERLTVLREQREALRALLEEDMRSGPRLIDLPVV